MARCPDQIVAGPPDDRTLLAQYAQDRSATAFTELAHRYADLVYSAARRQLRDPHQADDVTQAVFILLAKKAGTIRGSVAGWLILTTHYCSRNAVKMAMRRNFHEQQAAKMKSEIMAQPNEQAWEEIAGSLDAAMARLKHHDRDAIALRYLKGMNMREVGVAMGISEDAARKRVERSMERLRTLLGVKPTAAAGLGEQILEHGTVAAPIYLVHLIGASGGAVAKGTVAAAVAQKAGSAMAWAHIKIAAIALTAAAVAVPTIPAAIHIVKSIATPQASAVQTPVPAPAAPDTPTVEPDAPPLPPTATEQQILAALQGDADLTVQKVARLSGRDLSDAIAAIDVDDSQAQMRSTVVQMTRVSLADGGVSIMTCSNSDTAMRLREELLTTNDDDFAMASGPLVVQAFGTPSVQLAAARALADDPGLQYMDSLRLRGRPLVRIRWSSASTVKRLYDRLHISDGIRKVDTGWFEDDGREFHLVTIDTGVSPEALSGWTGGSGIKYRSWGGTVFAIKNSAGDPYPGVYGFQPFDELACRVTSLSLSGIKIKSMLYVTDSATDNHSDPVIDTVCVVAGKEVPLRFQQSLGATPPSTAGDNSIQVDDVTVQSPQGPMSDAVQTAIKSALAIDSAKTP